MYIFDIGIFSSPGKSMFDFVFDLCTILIANPFLVYVLLRFWHTKVRVWISWCDTRFIKVECSGEMHSLLDFVKFSSYICLVKLAWNDFMFTELAILKSSNSCLLRMFTFKLAFKRFAYIKRVIAFYLRLQVATYFSIIDAQMM